MGLSDSEMSNGLGNVSDAGFFDARQFTDNEEGFGQVTNPHVIYQEDHEEKKEEGNLVEPRRSTLERLHLGFIARLIGRRGYASDEELKTPAIADLANQANKVKKQKKN